MKLTADKNKNQGGGGVSQLVKVFQASEVEKIEMKINEHLEANPQHILMQVDVTTHRMHEQSANNIVAVCIINVRGV
jgi:hypothetical protein